MRTRRRSLAKPISAVCVAAALIAGCSSTPSTDAEAYLPSEIDGKPVRDDTPLAGEFRKQMDEQADVATYSLGTVGGPEGTPTTVAGGQIKIDDVVPELLVFAATTEKEEEKPLGDLLKGDEVSNEEIEGQDVKFFEVGEEDVKLAFAVAQPHKNLYAVAFAFMGGQGKARTAITEMLKNSKS